MKQMTFGDAEYAGKRKKTRREVFLEEMDQVVPWKSLLDLIEPLYPIAGRRASSVSTEDDAASAPDAELVWVERSGDGRGALRDHADAGICGVDVDQGDSGRDDDPQFPAPAGGERAGTGDSAPGQRVPVAQRTVAQAREHCGRDDHRGAEFDEERGRRTGSGDAPDEERQG
jgi:hypothetical protein